MQYHIPIAHTLYTRLSRLHVRKKNMVESRHKDPYYPAIVTNKWIEYEPGEVHEENLEVGHEEYMEMDYEGVNSDEESDEDEDARGILSEPYPSGAIPIQPAEQEDPPTIYTA